LTPTYFVASRRREGHLWSALVTVSFWPVVPIPISVNAARHATR